MNALHFDEPVYLLVGIGVPAEINTVEHAYALLNDWPVWRRNSAYSIALNACKAALAGEIDADTARTMLAAFARRINGVAENTRTVAASATPMSRPIEGSTFCA